MIQNKGREYDILSYFLVLVPDFSGVWQSVRYKIPCFFQRHQLAPIEAEPSKHHFHMSSNNRKIHHKTQKCQVLVSQIEERRKDTPGNNAIHGKIIELVFL
jgi:hypothetical protein